MKATLDKNLFKVEKGWVVTKQQLPKFGDWYIDYHNKTLCQWDLNLDTTSELPWCNVVIATINFNLPSIPYTTVFDFGSVKSFTIETNEEYVTLHGNSKVKGSGDRIKSDDFGKLKIIPDGEWGRIFIKNIKYKI